MESNSSFPPQGRGSQKYHILKKLGSNGLSGLCKYIHFYFSLILCEPFLRAFEQEKGTGQLNLNGRGLCREKIERMVITSDKKWPSFVGKWGQRSPTLLLLQLEHSCDKQLYWYHGNDQNDLGINFHCWHAWEGMFCNYEVTYSSMKLFKSVFKKSGYEEYRE